MKRRSFLIASSATVASGFAQSPQPKRRVAVIGHTGRGNYGHGLDTVWQKIANTEIVAVADGNESGLANELKKLGIDRGYTDYRKMLSETRPEFVSVCPRHADQHHDMALAAIEAGVKGLYIEKPFCRTPAEADALIAACKKHGATIAVAHRNRYHPTLAQIDKLIADGELGKLLQIRGRGKGDRRGGGEDLWVLGSHIVNLIHYFAGAPKSCSAIMLQGGRRITAEDVKPGAEGLGLLAANEVHARYETQKGIVAYYDSIANDGTEGNAYCMQLIGSKGTVTIHIDRDPVAHFTPGNPYQPTAEPRPWIPISTAAVGLPENQKDVIASVHNHVLAVRDLIDACDNNRAPLCDAHAGAVTVEMICGVFESHRQGGKTVYFPLVQRENALSLL
ncbi:Gfo/Idh/MocA family protein [Fuerstiella marisgermanici]|uniref:Inositol 2-dehydrogenase n=1 Tax=Fuerstiella marisgermanici TaxID=1891926 RepID=A0A1P8WR40_9PLAN|nr:Gfo/Idh/MocA family oxidoreductase [Fuerstiella marisgermanici]APZ96523.1 Inositol 2-dehydrogenase [Fuerstiella marisgermanici]